MPSKEDLRILEIIKENYLLTNCVLRKFEGKVLYSIFLKLDNKEKNEIFNWLHKKGE